MGGFVILVILAFFSIIGQFGCFGQFGYHFGHHFGHFGPYCPFDHFGHFSHFGCFGHIARFGHFGHIGHFVPFGHFGQFGHLVNLVFIPEKLIGNLICEIHKKFKPQTSVALAGFHSYPKVVKWMLTNSYPGPYLQREEGKKTIEGVKLYFKCKHTSSGCESRKVMVAIATEVHGTENHVVFQNQFQESQEHNDILLRHIHAQGAASKRFRSEPSNVPQCCSFDMNLIPEDFREISDELKDPFHKIKTASLGGPVLNYMEANDLAYREDAVAAQMTGRFVTYVAARKAKLKENEEKRPWIDNNEQKLDDIDKARKIQHYVDELCCSREKKQNFKNPYPYFIQSI